MYHTLVSLHSYNRYFLFAALLFVLYRSLSGWIGKKNYENADNTSAAALVGLAHLQLILGLILYFGQSPYVQQDLSSITDPVARGWVRYFKMEHISTMILAVALIQVGRIVSKKATEPLAKHKKMAIYTLIATLLIVSTLAMKGLLFGTVAQASATN